MTAWLYKAPAKGALAAEGKKEIQDLTVRTLLHSVAKHPVLFDQPTAWMSGQLGKLHTDFINFFYPGEKVATGSSAYAEESCKCKDRYETRVLQIQPLTNFTYIFNRTVE